jgi:hypothetical protein
MLRRCRVGSHQTSAEPTRRVIPVPAAPSSSVCGRSTGRWLRAAAAGASVHTLQIIVAPHVDRRHVGALLFEVEGEPAAGGAHVQYAQAFHDGGKSVAVDVRSHIVLPPNRLPRIEGEGVVPVRMNGGSASQLLPRQLRREPEPKRLGGAACRRRGLCSKRCSKPMKHGNPQGAVVAESIESAARIVVKTAATCRHGPSSQRSSSMDASRESGPSGGMPPRATAVWIA